MELLESIGQTEPGLQAMARKGFPTLGLQTCLTAGPKEARAWTIHQGDTAPQAAGVIHTDFERGSSAGDRAHSRPDGGRVHCSGEGFRQGAACSARTT